MKRSASYCIHVFGFICGTLTYAQVPVSKDLCGQSPIDLDLARNSGLPSDVKIAYSKSVVFADDQADEVVFAVRPKDNDDNNELVLKNDPVEYELTQFHLHNPNEHDLKGVNGAELHLVNVGYNQKDEKKISVVGVFVVEGAPNPVIESLARLISDNENSGTELEAETILDLRYLLPENSPVYRYTGSLTAGKNEPFINPVEWRVFSKPIEASKEQLSRLRARNGFHSARINQPICGRSVRLDAS